MKLITPFDYYNEIAPNLWMSGTPAYMPSPPDFPVIVNLAPFAEFQYPCNPGQLMLTWEIYDGPVLPDPDKVRAIADFVNLMRASRKVLVHCQMGWNRSGLVVATALVRGGMAPDEAIDLIRRQRAPECLSNVDFYRWLLGGGATA